MKIAVVGAKGLPPRQGGIEHHCAEIYSRMASQGHQVEFFARASYHQLDWNTRYMHKNVQVITLPSMPLRGADALLNSGLAATIASFRQFDIIHFHALGPALFSWVPRLLSPRTKVLVTCHGLDWQRAKWGPFSTALLKLGERTAVRCAHGIGVVSEELQRYFLEQYQCETTYISNAPASYERSDPQSPFVRAQGLTVGRYVLFLGRIVPEKRPDLLIKAFNQLDATDWKLVLVGGVSDTVTYAESLKVLAKGHANVLFSGELHGKRLAEIVRGAGLFALPSEVEGLPLALLEAMREEIPVITSDIPVHRQILGPDRGLWFEAGNTQACTATLRWAIENLDAMTKRAHNARQYVERNHTWDSIAANWLALYQKKLGRSKVVKRPVAF